MADDLEALRRELERLKKENATLREKVESGAAAIGDGAQAVGEQGIAARDVGGDLLGAQAVKIVGNVYLGPEPDNPEKAVRIYLSVLLRATANLPLRGIDLGVSDATQAQQPIELANVYIDLDTKSVVKVSGGQKRTVPSDETIADRGGDTRPLPALEALIHNRQMVLLGDPGGGKSTFVNFLAHCLAANNLDPRGGWLRHLTGWPKKEANLLPLLVVLRDFAHTLPEKLPGRAEPHHLLDFILNSLKAQNLDFIEKPLCQALESGRILLLLDGLDEVPTAQQRRFVRDAVTVFLGRYPDNRCLVTCRVLSYQPPRSVMEEDLRLRQLPDFELALFDAEKIQRFVGAWYLELERIHSIRPEDRQGLTSRLQDAVQRPDLQDLASNPLLLTVMALVHTHKGRLPDARALLYEDTVDILLWR